MGGRQCTATSKRSGEQCKRIAAPGATKCYMHGGRTAKAQQRATEDRARAELARLDLPPVDDPLSELARITGQVIGWKDQIAAKVNELTSLRYEGEGSGEQLRAEVALWERALDRCERFLTAMARLNIDERLASISEARAEVIISVFAAALERAGVEGDLANAVLTAADEEFARAAGIAV
jgi:hypothetical protein